MNLSLALVERAHQRIVHIQIMKSTHTSLAPFPLEVRHLRLVRAIANHGNVTRAARELHLSQSAVSHQLLDLERDLGTRLFDRVGRRMVATPSGVKLLEGAHKVLRDLSALERELASAREGARTPLRVACSCYTAYHWLSKVLVRFASDHPRIDLDIVLDATRRTDEAMASDEIDLAIVTDPPHDERWSSRLLLTGELVAVVSPKHEVFARRLANPDRLRWGALRDARILVHDITKTLHANLEHAVRTSWRRESRDEPKELFTLQKVPLTESIVELTRAGAGVAIVDRWTVAPYESRDVVLLPMTPKAPRTFYAVWRKSNPRRLPMQELIELVLRHVSRWESTSASSRHSKRPSVASAK